MVRVLIVFAVLAVAFIVVSLVDCALQPATRHRGVSKPAWIVLIIVLPVIGAVLWFVIGRGQTPTKGAMRAPDDDPEFLSRVGMPSDQDERIRRLEEELAQLDAEDVDPRWGAHGAGPVVAADEGENETPDAAAPGDTTPDTSNSAPTPGAKPDADGDDPSGQRHGSIG